MVSRELSRLDSPFLNDTCNNQLILIVYCERRDVSPVSVITPVCNIQVVYPSVNSFRLAHVYDAVNIYRTFLLSKL